MCAAGYFDLQVNGYMGVDFNKDDLTAKELAAVCKHLSRHGVDGILATITSEHIDVMARRLVRIVELRAQDKVAAKMIPGFHIEGPFINETDGYRGAHPKDATHGATPDEMKILLEAAGGLTRMVTLAPERDVKLRTTKMLAKQGIKVSAGHCNPSLDELKGAIDAGLSMFTHVGNGCPMMMHRHDNIVQRALSYYKDLWLCFIADGAHVTFTALGNYLRSAGIDNCLVVTDAIAAAGMGPGHYTLGRWDLVIGKDMVARAPDGSHLVGAAYTMKDAYKNLTKKVGLSDRDARKLLVTNPRKAIA